MERYGMRLNSTQSLTLSFGHGWKGQIYEWEIEVPIFTKFLKVMDCEIPSYFFVVVQVSRNAPHDLKNFTVEEKYLDTNPKDMIKYRLRLIPDKMLMDSNYFYIDSIKVDGEIWHLMGKENDINIQN